MRQLLDCGDRSAGGRAAILGVRGALLHQNVVVRGHVQVAEEVRTRAGHDFVLVSVPDHGRGLSAVPHEQFAVPARSGLCADRVLYTHGPVDGDPREGRPACARWHHHPVPQVHPDVQLIQHIVSDRVLGSQLHLHGAPIRQPWRQFCQRDRALPATGDQLQRRGADG